MPSPGGSTEWGEEHELLLQQRAVAYLNVDSGVAGKGFWASATPSLDRVVLEATKLVGVVSICMQGGYFLGRYIIHYLYVYRCPTPMRGSRGPRSLTRGARSWGASGTTGPTTGVRPSTMFNLNSKPSGDG